jgi:Trk K+ transport system NAD-binding subunit
MRDGQAQMAEGEIELRAGDQVLAVLEPGREEELRKVLLRKGG